MTNDKIQNLTVTFSLPGQFEDDLHTHVHLENNVLFPKFIKSAN